MDTDFRGFAVGPAPTAEALSAELDNLTPVPVASLHQLAPESVWCVLELERHALAVAERLPSPASTAAPTRPASRGSTRMAVVSSSSSRWAAMSDTTSGHPALIASATTLGNPS